MVTKKTTKKAAPRNKKNEVKSEPKKTSIKLTTKIRQERASGSLEAEVQSGKNIHIFELNSLGEYRNEILAKLHLEEKEGIQRSILFWEQFQGEEHDLSDCLVDEIKVAYRVCPAGRKPLDTTGSVINGGRHHVGGPQQHVLFPSVTIFFALYLACELKTAVGEYTYYLNGIPLGKCDKGYELKLKKLGKVYDLDKVVKKIDNQLLTKNISTSPVWGEWKYQKYPHITQLIGFILFKKYEADGLVFNSTKDPEGKNLVLFFDSNDPSIVGTKIKSEKEASLEGFV